MKLEKFKQKDPKRIGISIFTGVCILLIAGVFFYTSFASFEVKENFNIIEGTVGNNGDLYFSFYVENEISSKMPQKGEGYVLDTEKTTCTKGASVEFNTTEWAVKVVNMTEKGTKCNLYFRKQTFSDAILACNDTAANCLNNNASLNTVELVYDGTTDNNLRYIGADPNNYVSFNNELWRIIGVFNNIDDGTGNKESRLKIIRAEPIGKYSWDNKASGTGSSTSNYGSNDWSDSALQLVLNEGAYWNRTTGECPYGSNGATTSCDFSSTGLTEEAKSMIGNVLWNLGGTASYTISSNGLASHWYSYERGTTVYSGHTTKWIGKIGLMYPSDYGYATSGGTTTDRETCLNKELYNWNSSSYSDCKNNDWLYNSSNAQWTLTPNPDNSRDVFSVLSYGDMYFASAHNAGPVVSPALYLKANVKIIVGTGTSSDPFILSL